jgi:lipopolysaccharide/colanic/teichoic acid biosynthesis glycosyltransferase
MIYGRTPKRLCDLTLAGAALLLSSPIHAVCALLIWVTSGRPVYFTQERAGRDGRPFKLLKFRTMLIGTHEASGGYHPESAVTGVGRFLRRSSLDELPQLVNIVRGEMSIVGPRPALPEQVTRYTTQQRRRLEARPGLTGLAQLRYRNTAPWSVRIRSDIEYVDSISFRTDATIVLRTIPSVLFGTGVVSAGQTAASVDDLGERP